MNQVSAKCFILIWFKIIPIFTDEETEAQKG